MSTLLTCCFTSPMLSSQHASHSKTSALMSHAAPPLLEEMGVVQGYEKLGFRREGNTVVYREWCPAATSAQLIGDFNGWGGTHMEKDGSGVWKAVLPDGDCLPSLHQHATLLLVICHVLDGRLMLQALP